ncbi:MAG: exodeoxyribonuclease VII large subunit [Oscillospiraceae bacterium]|nr:exodeoxyribonuclease VII large subunit [Oscillospiraceae bacterium]
MNERSVLRVAEVNALVKRLLDGEAALQNLAVAGELSNYKIYPSGHHYFTLKDADSALRCVMFKGNALRLRYRPENGLRVTALGRLTVFPRDGVYQLYCTELIPQGVGDLQLAFEQLRRRLAAEGLFDPAHKKPIPRFPRRIAVITSGAGAAVRDIIRVAGRRWPMTQLCIMPVRVQGAEAPPELVGALNYANRWRVADLILIGRGGGSMEDLWAFNDERVARAIYQSAIPVISAVGHEPDVTIADYVADLRAATPSNGAELALPDQTEVRAFLAHAAARSAQAQRRRLENLRRRLDALRSRRVLESPTGHIDVKRMELDLLRERLLNSRQRSLTQARRDFTRLTAALDALSPLKVLSRGYAIAAGPDGRVLRSVTDSAPGAAVRVTLRDGALDCRVEDIERKEAEHGRAEGTGL